MSQIWEEGSSLDMVGVVFVCVLDMMQGVPKVIPRIWSVKDKMSQRRQDARWDVKLGRRLRY
jgi:hypothetical protein